MDQAQLYLGLVQAQLHLGLVQAQTHLGLTQAGPGVLEHVSKGVHPSVSSEPTNETQPCELFIRQWL